MSNECLDGSHFEPTVDFILDIVLKQKMLLLQSPVVFLHLPDFIVRAILVSPSALGFAHRAYLSIVSLTKSLSCSSFTNETWLYEESIFFSHQRGYYRSYAEMSLLYIQFDSSRLYLFLLITNNFKVTFDGVSIISILNVLIADVAGIDAYSLFVKL